MCRRSSHIRQTASPDSPGVRESQGCPELSPLALRWFAPPARRAIEQPRLFEPAHRLSNGPWQPAGHEGDLVDDVGGQRRPRLDRDEVAELLRRECVQDDGVDARDVGDQVERGNRIAMRR